MTDYCPGIDVSTYQGVIDWTAVANSGVVYAMLRATVGNWKLDNKFNINWNGAKSAGLFVTAYHVVDPDNTPESQVAYFLDALTNKAPDLPLVLDCEMSRGLPAHVIQSNIERQVAWLPLVNGLKPLIYTNQSFGNTSMKGNCGCDLWVANYTAAPEPRLPKWWSTWRFWQYSCTGRVPGVSSNVDLNRYNGTENDMRRWLGLDVEPDPLLVWAQAIDAWARFEGYDGPHPPQG